MDGAHTILGWPIVDMNGGAGIAGRVDGGAPRWPR
jgi:hypothetical protein